MRVVVPAVDSSRRGRVALAFHSARLGPLRGGGLWGSALVAVTFLTISVMQYGQPYVIDEAVFPYVADGILKNGAPYFYNGDSRPNDVGLWHPPLYSYLLAGNLFIWGVSTFAVRSFGAICIGASFFVLSLALKRIAPDLKQYGYPIMGALFMLNPLVISGALVPDIDGTLGVLLVSLAIWLSAVVVGNVLTRPMVIGLFGFAVLAVSTKFILAGLVAVMLGCAALSAPAQRWWKAAWVIVAFVAGTAVSLAVLFSLGAILQFDAAGPFAYLFGSLESRGAGRSGLNGAAANLLSGPGSNMIWIGPAIILSSVVGYVAILVIRPPGVSRRLAGLALLSSAAIILGYSYITASPFSFPKYTAIAVPGLAVVTALFVSLFPRVVPARIVRSLFSNWGLASLYVAVLVLGCVGLFVLDARTQPRALNELVLLTGGAFVGVLAATIVLVLARNPGQDGLSLGFFNRSLGVGLIAALVIAPIMVQVSTSLVNATAPFATRYYYGERGMSEFLVRANETMQPGGLVVAAKDIGLQLSRPFYEDAFLLPLEPSELRTELARIDAPYFITRRMHDYSEAVYPEQFDVVREFYVPIIADRGSDFRLWRLK